MPVDPKHYCHRGGGNYGIVLYCPALVADRLVYFDHNRERGSWVIRDLVGGWRLDDRDSPLTVSAIEALADYDEYPPWRNVEHEPREWEVYLRLRSTAFFRRREVSLTAPNSTFGQWEPLLV